ncbi:MAG TPA: hypothetical protein PKG49_07005 [Nitrosomonas mobilis]|nr:hypothetical protein [Nitrosomonas mobilis]
MPIETLNLVIDNTLIPYQPERAPSSIVRYGHARKHNRPQFLLAQCWVTLGVSVLGSSRDGEQARVRILFDTWFMRAWLILPSLLRKISIIEQARRDTALFLPLGVAAKPGRGRPRIYEGKMTPEAIQNLPATEIRLTLYGKEQRVHLHTVGLNT